jgi:hypothetical protein
MDEFGRVVSKVLALMFSLVFPYVVMIYVC